MTLNEQLRQNKKIWDIQSDYDRPAIIEVLNYNKQFQKENKCIGYIDRVKDFILSKEKIDSDLLEMLGTEIYLSNADIEKENQGNYSAKMEKEGWKKLTEDIVKQAITENKKIAVNAFSSCDWLTVKIDDIYKPCCFNGNYGLMKPKARRRGYFLHQFKNAFCKLI